MRAYGMPRLTKDESTTRAQTIQAVLKKATLVPMRCCRACREVITIGGVVAEKGNRNVVSPELLPRLRTLRCGALP